MWFKNIKIFFDKSGFYISFKFSAGCLYLYCPDMPYFHEQKTGQECITGKKKKRIILALLFRDCLTHSSTRCSSKTQDFPIQNLCCKSGTYCVIFVINHNCGKRLRWLKIIKKMLSIKWRSAEG